MKRIFVWTVFAVCLGFAWSNSALEAWGAPPTGFTDQTVVSGLKNPVDYAFAPDGRMFIAEIGGQILVYKNGQVLGTPALSLASSSAGISVGGDRGLMSFTLDPNFSSNHFIYVLYTTAANHERISRFTFNGDVIDPASEGVLLENPEAWGGFLDAGAIRYNPVDGKLYATMGSNGEGMIAQDLASMNGKLLRINLDGSIPADNPFVNLPGAIPAIWSSGFRNPFRINVDTINGTVLIGDVGVVTWEKVVRSARGANFGWPTFEGDCTPNCGSITPPIYVYNHNGGGAAIMGGDVYKGNAFPASYAHAYFYGDFNSGWVATLSLDANGNVIGTSTFDPSIGTKFDLVNLNSEPDGCMYYDRYVTGDIHKYCYVGAGGGAFTGTVAASTDAGAYAPGASEKITTSATANQNNSNVLLDTEVWGPGGKMSQNIVNPFAVSQNAVANSLWMTTAPTTAGTYTVKVGLFSPNWSSLYAWNDQAATFTVGNGIPPSPNLAFTDSATVNGTSFAPGASATITANATANQAVANLNFDIELWSSSGKLLQQVVLASFNANQQVSVPWNLTAPSAPGNYTVKIGIFASDWSKLYDWDNAAATLVVGNSGTPPLSFVVNASLPSSTYPSGAHAVLTTNVAATQNLSVNIDTEVVDANQNLVLQNVLPANLLANQQFSSPWNVSMPNANGGYTVKVGIFSLDWSKLYFWQNRSFQFTVGPPAGSPQPGQIYPVTVLQPQNNQNVSGTVEIKAVINGLDINSYTLAWRTATSGSYFPLDVDPVTQSFKHSWIDFSTWNWMPNHLYPITFLATDLSNNVIGSTTITVIH